MNLSRRHLLFGSLAMPVIAAAAKPAPVRPSVVLLLADELPAWVLGAYGNKEFRTPNLDRLAQSGTRFLNHYACAPAPVAGRSSLLTGRTPMQLSEGGTLSAGDIPLAKILAGAEYACLEGDSAQAQQFLDRQSPGKPFFLTVNFAIRTGGLPQKYYDLYAGQSFEAYAPDPVSPNAVTREMLSDIKGNVRKVAAAVSSLDDDVAALLSKVRQRSLVDSTLVVFTSGCGALLGRHGLWGAAGASDPPNMYEETVTTPMFWSWPGHVPAQAVRPEMVSSFDFLPSICDAVAAAVPAGNLCGRSYVPLATGKPLPKKWPWRRIVCAQYRNTAMAREEQFKVVLRNDGKGPNEFYDLVHDARERNNQFDDQQYLTVRTELTNEWSVWKQKYST